MDVIPEDILTCGHCCVTLGTLSFIIEKELTIKHKCLIDFQNIHVEIQTGKVYGQKTRIDKENASPGCSGSQTTLSSCTNLRYEAIAESPSTSRSSHPSSGEKEVPWTEDMIKLLIQSYVTHKEKFSSPLYTKTKVWDRISKDLEKYGVKKSGKKCDEKWRNIKKTYEKILCQRNKTGSAPITWKFFDDLHDIYAKDPQFNPISTASSSGTYQRNDQIEVVKKDLSPGEKSRVRAITALELDNKKQKRHEERMALKRKMFEWFRENYKKKEREDEERE